VQVAHEALKVPREAVQIGHEASKSRTLEVAHEVKVLHEADFFVPEGDK